MNRPSADQLVGSFILARIRQERTAPPVPSADFSNRSRWMGFCMRATNQALAVGRPYGFSITFRVRRKANPGAARDVVQPEVCRCQLITHYRIVDMHSRHSSHQAQGSSAEVSRGSQPGLPVCFPLRSNQVSWRYQITRASRINQQCLALKRRSLPAKASWREAALDQRRGTASPVSSSRRVSKG